MTTRSLLTLLLLATASFSSAAEITVTDPWVREAPPGATAIGAYLVLENSGDNERVLIAVSSPISDTVEIHRTIQTDGVARMEQQHAIIIPAGGRVVFEPGGFHLMIIGPGPVKAGDTVPFTLKMRDGGSVTMDAEVRRVMGGDAHQHHHHN